MCFATKAGDGYLLLLLIAPRAHTAMSARQVLPGDLEDWLQRLQLQRRIGELKANPVSAFCDGRLVAEIVQNIYPKFPGFESSMIEESLNMDARLKNWELLQNKVLAVISCDLQRHDMICIARREIDKAAVMSFLRIFRAKLSSYHPQYLEHTRHLAAKQRQLGKSQPQQTSSSASSSGAPSSASKPPPGKKVSKEVRSRQQAREAVKQTAAGLSEADIDAMYRDVSGRYKAKADSDAQELDERQKRIENIDANISRLREQNLQDMVKAETRLAHLHMQLNALATPSAAASSTATIAASSSAFEAEAEREESERFGAGRGGGQASKTAHLTRLIMTELRKCYGTDAKSRFPTDRRKAMEQRITRKSSVILSRLGLATTGSAFAVGAPSGGGKDAGASDLDRLADLSLTDEDNLLAMDDAAMHRHVVASFTGGASFTGAASPGASGGSVFSFGGRSVDSRSPRARSPSPSKAGAAAKTAMRGSSASVGSLSAASKAPAPPPSSSSSVATRAPAPTPTLAPATAPSSASKPSSSTSASSAPASAPASSSTNSGKPLATMTHRRIYDDHHQRHFYVDEATGKSAWHLPKEGIVACSDEQEQIFFIHAATKKSAWKLEDLDCT